MEAKLDSLKEQGLHDIKHNTFINLHTDPTPRGMRQNLCLLQFQNVLGSEIIKRGDVLRMLILQVRS